MELRRVRRLAGEVTDGVGVDVGAPLLPLPDNDFGPVGVIEFYAKVKPTIGPVALTLGIAYAAEQDSLPASTTSIASADAAIPFRILR